MDAKELIINLGVGGDVGLFWVLFFLFFLKIAGSEPRGDLCVEG